MKRRRNRVPSDINNRWFERYGEGGFFCLPRTLLFNLVGCIDNATLYVYVALASCHFEGNTTYVSAYLTKLTGKDERAVRGHLADLETLGLIRREPLGQGYRIVFECPDRERIKQGAAVVQTHKEARKERRRAAAEQRAGSQVG
jgi:hypothetical protein